MRNRRYVLVCLIMSLILMLMGTALAKSSTMYIKSLNSAPVNMRGGPSRDSRVVATLVTGTKVTVLGTEDSWTKIQVGDTEGYVMTLFLTETDPSIETIDTGSIRFIQSPNSAPVNLREKASRSSKVITELVTGTQVSVQGLSGEWANVQVASSGVKGFVLSQYLTATDPYGKNGTSKVGKATVYIVSPNGGNVNIRESASSTARLVDQVSSGTVATLLKAGSQWSQVQVDNATGYVMNEYISYSQPQGDAADTGTTKYMFVVSPDSAPVNLRESQSRSSKVLDRLVSGTVVEVLSISGSWSQIRVGDKTGYMMNMYLSSTAPKSTNVKEYKAYVTTPNRGTVRLRYGAGTGYEVVTTLDYGTQVTVIGSVNGWARVRCGNYEGYINETYLTKKKPD